MVNQWCQFVVDLLVKLILWYVATGEMVWLRGHSTSSSSVGGEKSSTKIGNIKS